MPAVLDFSLQMRFWRGVTEAFLEGTTASLAAASEFQSHLLAPSNNVAKVPPVVAAPLMNPFGWWQDMLAINPFFATRPDPQPAPSNPYQHFAVWNPWAAWAPPRPAPVTPENWMKLAMDLWTRPPMWAATNPWAMWQTPMTAMMMSAGMPFSVASPAARAGAASMDAADAAHQQMQKVYSAYRSDGGHAAAQLVVLPWAIAASFLSAEPSAEPIAEAPPPPRWRH